MSVHLVNREPVSRAPRVLTDELVGRLSIMNAAERELRAMNIEVEYAMLTDGRPEIGVVRRPDQSLAPLLDKMGPRDYRQAGQKTLVSGLFMGCTVNWLESRA